MGSLVTKGVVVDGGRQMDVKVLGINEQEGWVRVQAGVVKDQLNDAVRAYGLCVGCRFVDEQSRNVGWDD